MGDHFGSTSSVAIQQHCLYISAHKLALQLGTNTGSNWVYFRFLPLYWKSFTGNTRFELLRVVLTQLLRVRRVSACLSLENEKSHVLEISCKRKSCELFTAFWMGNPDWTGLPLCWPTISWDIWLVAGNTIVICDHEDRYHDSTYYRNFFTRQVHRTSVFNILCLVWLLFFYSTVET